MLDLSMREWSSLLGVLAFAGVLWRTIEYFELMTSLERALSGVLIGLSVAGAIGTFNLDRGHAPTSGVLPYVLVLRLVVLVIVAFWPKLVGRTGNISERLGLKP